MATKKQVDGARRADDWHKIFGGLLDFLIATAQRRDSISGATMKKVRRYEKSRRFSNEDCLESGRSSCKFSLLRDFALRSYVYRLAGFAKAISVPMPGGDRVASSFTFYSFDHNVNDEAPQLPPDMETRRTSIGHG